MQKAIGWITMITLAVIITYNVKQSREDEKKFAKDPWGTLLSGGKNLSDAYSFTPPFMEYEMVVMGAGVIGLILVLTAKNKQQKQ